MVLTFLVGSVFLIIKKPIKDVTLTKGSLCRKFCSKLKKKSCSSRKSLSRPIYWDSASLEGGNTDIELKESRDNRNHGGQKFISFKLNRDHSDFLAPSMFIGAWLPANYRPCQCSLAMHDTFVFCLYVFQVCVLGQPVLFCLEQVVWLFHRRRLAHATAAETDTFSCSTFICPYI